MAHFKKINCQIIRHFQVSDHQRLLRVLLDHHRSDHRPHRLARRLVREHVNAHRLIRLHRPYVLQRVH